MLNGRRAIVIFGGAMLVLLALAGCVGEPAETVEGPAPVSPQRQAMDAAAQAWQGQGIDSYTMKVQYNPPGWNAQLLDITVRDHEAEFVTHKCMPERTCALRQLDEADFTIDRIISSAQLLIDRGVVEHVVYHETYDFPRVIESPEGTWILSDFKPLEE